MRSGPGADRATVSCKAAPNAQVENGAQVIKFFDWALKNGSAMADQLDYVPLPAPVVTLIDKQFATIKDASGKVVATSN